MKLLNAVVIVSALASGSAEAATILTCKFPNPKSVTGFDSSNWLFDGDRLRQMGAYYKEMKDDVLASMRIVSMTPERIEARWWHVEDPDNTPTLIVDRDGGVSVEMMFGADSNRRQGLCIIREHELDGSEIDK